MHLSQPEIKSSNHKQKMQSVKCTNDNPHKIFFLQDRKEIFPFEAFWELKKAMNLGYA